MEIRRLRHQEIPEVHALMVDVVSRLPSYALFSMDNEDYLHAHIQDRGEIYGAAKAGFQPVKVLPALLGSYSVQFYMSNTMNEGYNNAGLAILVIDGRKLP
ncbi:MAG: hypothetical protein K0S39_4259 [Paenibacillus sp.]|jgi:hypothetical protein|nr:hypothetical protein [Paenibacillus sp.]